MDKVSLALDPLPNEERVRSSEEEEGGVQDHLIPGESAVLIGTPNYHKTAN